MIYTSVDGYPPEQAKTLRLALKGLPSSSLIVCEDHGYKQAFVDVIKICTHVAVGDGRRHFLSKEQIEGHREEYPGDAILALVDPVLCLEVGAFFENKKEST